MKILNLSLSANALDPQTFVAERSRWYGEIVDAYTMIVPTPEKKTVHLSKKVTVYGSGGANKLLQLWNMYRRARQVIRGGCCDVVTSQDPYYVGLLAYYLAKRFHLGLEIQMLGFEKFRGVRIMIARYVLHRAGVVRVLSKRLYNRFRETFDIDKERMIMVPIHVSVQRLAFNPQDAESKERMKQEERSFHERYGSCINFLTVSRIVPIKNIALQIKAMKQLHTAHPNARLHIVGDGSEKLALKKLRARLGLSGVVLFHGWKDRESLGAIYTQANCFLLTSFYEGWGMVIVEAANAGLPIIMTDVGCAGELIKDGKSGFVISSNDLPALCAAMQIMITDPDKRKNMGDEAKRAVDQLPTRDEVVVQYKRAWTYASEHRL